MRKLKPTGSVQTADDLCRFFATDGSEEFEILLPLETFVALASRAQAQQSHETILRSDPNGDYRLDKLRVGSRIELATTVTVKPAGVAMIIDRGRSGEVGVALTRESAIRLSQELLNYVRMADEEK